MDIRLAGPGDLEALRKLDNLAFPPGNPDLEPSGPMELERGLEHDELWLGFEGNKPVGFLHVERIEEDRFNLISLVISPDFQRRGFGRQFLAFITVEFLKGRPKAEITCVTSPRNAGMIAALLSSGFIGTSIVRDFFGPGKDRLVFQFSPNRFEYVHRNQMYVPLESSIAIEKLMASGSMHIVSFHLGSQGDLVELAKFVENDVAGLRQTEANTSVAQASGVLAALTFLLGFSFVDPDYSLPLRLFLIVGIVATLGSIQVYANSTGNMVRIGDGSFDAHMKWGNLLLDFGGHYPLVLILPALFVSGAQVGVIAFLVGTIVTVLLVAYELSPFSIFRRHQRTAVGTVLMYTTSLLPMLAAPIEVLLGSQAVWVILSGSVLLLRFGWQARRNSFEGHRVIAPRGTSEAAQS
jgi:GNAT superfamily N-acetyltransferase